MSTVLRELEARLEKHFSDLAEQKRREKFPVFALEHCLEPREVNRLGQELGRSLRSLQGMTPAYQLCWLVHAAEVGYGFDGTEYWHSFGEATPHWNYEHRNDFVDFFESFARRYGGVKPKGRWAKHYRYISWPVAHALLPHDLQLQLARSIYNARHRLPEIARLDPTSTGEFIDRHTFERTSRYGFFLEQRELVGWIVHALMQAETAQTPILYRPTLDRILARLNAAAHTREWLKDAQRQYAKNTFHLPWSARQPGAHPPIASGGERSLDVTGPMPALLTPMLSLRFESEARARVYVELPSFQQLLNLHGEFRNHFDIANVRIPSNGDALMPALMLLSGSGRQRPLRRWPKSEEVLAEFSPALQAFDQLVSSECRLPRGDLWLFKQNSAGVAIQIVSNTLRPGERYVAVAKDQGRFRALPGQTVDLQCEGVVGLTFDVPLVVPQSLEKTYRSAGLPMHRTVRVEPVGLFPRAWRNDSLGEWLSTEVPCFALERDHSFDTYQIRCNEGIPQTFHCGSESAVIVSLQDLDVGTHVIDIATRVAAAGTGTHIPPSASARFHLHVRRPSIWVAGELCARALVVETHPRSPKLLEFLGDTIELSASGDPGRQVTCSLALLDATGATTSAIPICKQSLPLTSYEWSEAVRRLLGRPSDELEFLAAAGAQIIVDGEDLGERRIPLQHTPSPVRWAVNKTKDDAFLRLIDDGADHAVEITWTDFATPLRILSLDREAAHVIDVKSRSGLFLAHAVDHSEAVIVSPRGVGKGLQWLGVNFSANAFNERDLLKVLSVRSLWKSARPCSPISRIHQRQVAARLHQHAIELVGGQRWIGCERKLAASPQAQQWEALELCVDASRSYGLSLAHQWASGSQHHDLILQGIAQSVAKSFRTFLSDEVMTLAWEFADEETELSEAQGQAILQADRQKFPTLVRAARLLRLYREHRSPQRP